MLIDFQPVFIKEKTLIDLANEYSQADLGAALNSYIDFTLRIINDVSDEQAAYIPVDPDADDPHAALEADRHVGWSLIHLVMHVTATVEEAAAFSSILARGIPIGGRLRTERNWREVTTCAEAIAQLEECRRMCSAYLATWPDRPDLTARRIMPEDFKWPGPNASASFLAGLMHWHKHIEQFQQVAEQAHACITYDVCSIG